MKDPTKLLGAVRKLCDDNDWRSGSSSVTELISAFRQLDKHISDGGVLPAQWLQREWEWIDDAYSILYISHLRGGAIIYGNHKSEKVAWRVGKPVEGGEKGEFESIFCEGECTRERSQDALSVAQERCYFVLELFNQYTDEG